MSIPSTPSALRNRRLALVGVALLGSPWAFAQSLFQNGFEAAPEVACVEKSIRPVAGSRLDFAFPTANGAGAGSLVESACVRLTGIDNPLSFAANRGAWISINDGAYQPSPVMVGNGDSIRLRLVAPSTADASETSYVQIDGEFLADFSVRSANQSREPQLFEVGPGMDYRELSEVAGRLVAGDEVRLSRDAIYQPVEFRRAGLPQAPIIIRAASGNGARPRIEGGSITISLRGAHHYRLQQLEVTGGSEVCLRHEANDTWLHDSQVHGCARHGILGADLNSGSLRISATEVNDVGGQPPGENLKHPIYVATDRDRYPGSTLRVERSYVHDFGGNGVKSRAERAEIHQNWIEADSRGLYSIELNGFEEYLSEPGLEADVFGNVLIHCHAYGLRMGGDGTGALRGRVRLAHNTVLQGAGFNQYTPVLRFFHELQSVSVRNNVFARLADTAGALPLRLVRDDATWTQGSRHLEGERNWVPSGSDSIAEGYLPAEWQNTALATAPGFVSLNPAGPDLALQADSSVADQPVAAASADGNFAIDRPLEAPAFRVPTVAPTSGASMTGFWTAQAVQPQAHIGAH